VIGRSAEGLKGLVAQSAAPCTGEFHGVEGLVKPSRVDGVFATVSLSSLGIGITVQVGVRANPYKASSCQGVAVSGYRFSPQNQVASYADQTRGRRSYLETI